MKNGTGNGTGNGSGNGSGSGSGGPAHGPLRLKSWLWQSYLRAALVPLLLIELTFVGGVLGHQPGGL